MPKNKAEDDDKDRIGDPPSSPVRREKTPSLLLILPPALSMYVYTMCRYTVTYCSCKYLGDVVVCIRYPLRNALHYLTK